MRMLLTTRHLPADANYSVAINLIPVEFNDDAKVMEAWRRYIEVVQVRPSPENEEQHNRELGVRQTKLIYAMMQSLGFNLAETDIQTSAYVADGFIRRDNIMIGSWLAMTDIAHSLRAQSAYLGVQVMEPNQGEPQEPNHGEGQS